MLVELQRRPGIFYRVVCHRLDLDAEKVPREEPQTDHALVGQVEQMDRVYYLRLWHHHVDYPEVILQSVAHEYHSVVRQVAQLLVRVL